jgi:hypothetical protein
MVAVIAPGAVVMVVVAVVMAMVMVVVAVVMAVAAVVVAQVVIAVRKNEYFSFIRHSNGPNRVKDSYKVPIASYESLEFF